MTAATVAVSTPHRAGHLRPLLKIGLLVTVVVVVGSAIKAVVSPGPPPPCAAPCVSPPAGTNVSSANSFTSTRYGFSFQYPDGGRQVGVSGDQVVALQYQLQSGDFAGQVLVGATSTSTSAQALIDQESQSLGGDGITNLRPAGALNGAEIGYVPGSGEAFTGVYTDTVGNQDPVNIGIIAVPHAAAVVYFLGISVAASDHSTPPAFGVFDNILDHWTWSRP